jgi:hypothetical protein
MMMMRRRTDAARSHRSLRRWTPDPERSVLLRYDGGGHGAWRRYGEHRRANGHWHRDFARWMVTSGTAACATRNESWHHRHLGSVVIGLCEPRPFTRYGLCATHAGRWTDGRRDDALSGCRVGRGRAWGHRARTCLGPSTVLLVGSTSCVEQNL